MTKTLATKLAKKYSLQYGTFWYVVKTAKEGFQPWAHETKEHETIETFYSGQEWSSK